MKEAKFKTMFRYMIILAGSVFLLNKQVCSQGITYDKLVDFLPPAPNASAITKYGDASINKNTGAPNINIPLFTVKGIKLSTTISLGYSSTGIKVDEIASRVGMGWAINAGGVITRTMRGIADETNTRHYPYAPIGTNWATVSYMNRIKESAPNNGYDSEPDIFNFSCNGNSGSFVYDGGGNYLLVNKNGTKVESNFTYNATWNFKLTTPDGIVYLFGGPDAVEKTKRLEGCGKSYNSFIPTAWYLTKILHPNGESIEFTYTPVSYKYDNGVAQTMYYQGLIAVGAPCECTPIVTTTCVNSSWTEGVLLQSIESPGRSKIEFEYRNRVDCESDKLVSKIIQKDPDNVVGSFDLEYTEVNGNSGYNPSINNPPYSYGYEKTYYLTSLVENSSGSGLSVLHKTHYFSYIDPTGRPYRLSFAQDHWGYFNGKHNNSFTPDLGVAYHAAFPDAVANKEPDFGYSSKGLLNKIVYPTGGVTMIFYEPNMANDFSGYTTGHELICEVTGSGISTTETKTKRFNCPQNQHIQLHVQCTASEPGPYLNNQMGVVDIKTLSGGIVYHDNFSVGDNKNIDVYLTGTANYDLVISAGGNIITTSVDMSFQSNYTSSVSDKRMVGGARVQKIISAPTSADKPMVKHYFYGALGNLTGSSMYEVASPFYQGTMKRLGTNCSQGPEMGYWCQYQTLSSSSVFNLGYYNNSQVSYEYVVESNGDNFEGGGTETRFYIGNDALGEVVLNNMIINSPFTNFSSLLHARPMTETIVKKATDGSLVPIQRTEYVYNDDPSGEDKVFGYNISGFLPGNIGIDTTCTPSAGNWCNEMLQGSISDFDMVKYMVYSSWIYPWITTKTMYDENGQNPITTTVYDTYSNFQNFQLTSTESLNSKGQNIRTTNKYPHDFTGTQVYDEMIDRNMINAVVESKTENVDMNKELSNMKVLYDNTGNNNYVPVEIQRSVNGNTFETEGTIDLYDAKGNILQYTGKNGIVTSVVWGYNYQYPVAQVIGETYTNAVSSLTVSMSALQQLDGQNLLTELDHIRTGNPSARVTTYTYKPLTGITSITDPNNRKNSYEYDNFNRLSNIRDQDGNVVKKNEYNYVTPSPNASLTIYYNQELITNYQCSTCAYGFSGSSGSYVVPYGRYFSMNSQEEADEKAMNDRDMYGQEYVNRNGYCSNALFCSQPGYRFIDCDCVPGTMHCHSSSEDTNNPGYWNLEYHYTWPDGFIGPTITEQVQCPGPNKKVINCQCKPGHKVCDNVVTNWNGTYTVTYHYHWDEDNSNSASITETISCDPSNHTLINCSCMLIE